MSAMTPDAFEGALVAIIPQRVLPKVREVYLDAVLQLHEAVVVTTRVDTGYLRAGFQATAGDDAPQTLGPRDRKGDYTNQQIDPLTAVAKGAATLEPITLGFVAEYAPHVEDRYHMVKNARGQWPQIVESAIRNAEGK